MLPLRGRWPLVATVLMTTVGSVFLLLQARHLWFFGDDWAFLLGRSLGQRPFHALMQPHNEHWSAVPLVLFRMLYSVVGLHHFLAFALLPILAHAAVSLLFFSLLQRCGVQAWIAVGVTGVLVFLGAGAENLLWSFQVGMVSSAALGLGALLVATGPPGRRSVGVSWLLSVLALMSSGIALGMLMWLGAFVLLRHGLRRALVLTVPPMTVYAAWFITWGRDVDTGIPPSRLADVVPLAWKGLAVTWESMSGFAGAGPVIVIGLIAASLVLHPGSRRRTLALSGCAAALATYLLVAQSRGGLGPDSTTAGRYGYFGALMMLPALALVLQALVDRLAGRVVEAALAVAVVVGLLVVPGTIAVVTFREDRDTLTPDLRGRTIAASELARSGERLLGDRVDPDYNPDISGAVLARDDVAEALPDGPVTARDRLTARAFLQVAAARTTWGLPEAEASFSAAETTASGECVIGLGASGSVLEIPSGENGAQVRLTLSGTTSTTVRLRDGGVTSLPAPLPVGEAQQVYLGVTAPGVDLLVDLPPGAPFTVCGR